MEKKLFWDDLKASVDSGEISKDDAYAVLIEAVKSYELAMNDVMEVGGQFESGDGFETPLLDQFDCAIGNVTETACMSDAATKAIREKYVEFAYSDMQRRDNEHLNALRGKMSDAQFRETESEVRGAEEAYLQHMMECVDIEE